MSLFMKVTSASLFATMLSICWSPALAKSFLSSDGYRGEFGSLSLQDELTRATESALGCGGKHASIEVEAIESELETLWRSLQQTASGRIERRLLRYVVHRYFNRKWSLHIRGFEPSRPVNASSSWGEVDILSQVVPAYVESVLESRHKMESGFDRKDAALLIAIVQRLVFDSESSVLEKVYRAQAKPLGGALSHGEVLELVESFLIYWFVGDDDETVDYLLSSKKELEASIPNWQRIMSMAEGRLRALEYKRQQDPRGALADASARQGANAMSPRYSFEDIHGIVGTVITSFASFWESECQAMKDNLMKMDTHHTGRVPLSQFYSKTLDAEWRFGESESYLRDLGALDETGWLGKQVIIPNYIQGASNCIVARSHYLVCCVNECESLMGDLENAVGGPEASPSQLMGLVRAISFQTTLDDDFPPALQDSLTQQLESIAATNDGTVPLHGRLFAQWLHYAFPRECPFPHRAGEKAALTPQEFGESYLAQQDDMERHAMEANDSVISPHVNKDELQWMSQWSPEEELVYERTSRRFNAPLDGASRAGTLCALLAVLGILGLARRQNGKASGVASTWVPESKAHFV